MIAVEQLGRARRKARLAFALASLVTIALGASVMVQADVPAATWIRNPVAWLVAGGLAIIVARQGWLAGWTAPGALLVVTLSFLGPEQQGVHRWLDLGPVELNAAALVLPLAIATSGRGHPGINAACIALIAGALAWQPDISQLAGFVPAMIVLAVARFGWPGGAVAATVGAGAIALCLSRPDPLEPVAHVEGIFALAWNQSPIIALAMGASLAAAALSPLFWWRALQTERAASLALTAYFAATSLGCVLGPYPAPLAGYGLSFVVGWWLGMAALTSPRER